MGLLLRLFLSALILFSVDACSAGVGSHSGPGYYSSHRTSHYYRRKRAAYHPKSDSRDYRTYYSAKRRSKHYCDSCPRDSRGRIRRSSSAKAEFKRQTGYPHGRPGYVIDHIVPLKRGGRDEPSNMQWQTKKEAKEKDKWE